jgi:hypothetical protein
MHFKEMKEIMEGKQMDLAAAKYVIINRVMEIGCEVDGKPITDEQIFEYIKVIRDPMHKHKILNHILGLVAHYETQYGPDFYTHATVYYALGVIADAYDLPD